MSISIKWIGKLPDCDFCKELAKYDAKTIDGRWAYLCSAHFKKVGIRLGTGWGQELMPVECKLKEELVDEEDNHGVQDDLHMRQVPEGGD